MTIGAIGADLLLFIGDNDGHWHQRGANGPMALIGTNPLALLAFHTTTANGRWHQCCRQWRQPIDANGIRYQPIGADGPLLEQKLD